MRSNGSRARPIIAIILMIASLLSILSMVACISSPNEKETTDSGTSEFVETIPGSDAAETDPTSTAAETDPASTSAETDPTSTAISGIGDLSVGEDEDAGYGKFYPIEN